MQKICKRLREKYSTAIELHEYLREYKYWKNITNTKGTKLENRSDIPE